MFKCEICGKEFEDRFFGGGFSDVCNKCFEEKFWRLIVKEKDDHVFINGESYSIGDENSLGPRGFDGYLAKIRKFDDTEIVTTNLWYQGKIPEKFKNLLPDNAEFIR